MSRKLANSILCDNCGDYFIPGGAYASHRTSCLKGGPKKRRRTRYRELYIALHGIGPYPCYFGCEELVSFDELIVHHIDEDFSNDAAENLTAAHRSCHNGHHFKELWKERRDDMLASNRGSRSPRSEETKKAISDSHKAAGHAPSAEARELARQKNTGSHRSQETRDKISEYAKNRTPEHKEKLRQANLGHVVTDESRLKMSESAKARRAREKSAQEVRP